MRRRLFFDRSAATPDRIDVLAYQGIPAGTEIPPRVMALLEETMVLYSRLVAPTGIRAEIRPADFDNIYPGEGKNAERTPLEKIVENADRLALFAVTVGRDVSDEVGRLFSIDDPATACMLDSVASAGTERLAAGVAEEWGGELREKHEIGTTDRVLPYSPGYCGWHVSGQRRLFAALRPEEVGITLKESCLMRPLKSVSGVLVAADSDAHTFDIDYPFCVSCATQSCRERINSFSSVHGGV